jgi:hypothetical protein
MSGSIRFFPPSGVVCFRPCRPDEADDRVGTTDCTKLVSLACAVTALAQGAQEGVT